MNDLDFDLLMDVNLKASFLMGAAVIPALRANHDCIVNLSSDAVRQGNLGPADYAIDFGYSAGQ